MTIYNVMGRGLQKDIKQYYRGQEVWVDLFPKVKIEIVSPDEAVEQIVQRIITSRGVRLSITVDIYAA